MEAGSILVTHVTHAPESVDSGDWFERAMQSRERIRRAFGDQPVPDAVEIIHEMREERDQQILRNVRPDLFGDPA